jgi:hypothetical protein
VPSNPASQAGSSARGKLGGAPPAAAGGGGLGAPPCAPLSVRDVLVGFRDRREEAAFRLAKAQRLESWDSWLEGMITLSLAMGVPAVCYVARNSGNAHGSLFVRCAAVWWMWIFLPGVIHRAARPWYLAHRCWVWGVCLLLTGLSAAATGEVMVPRASYVALQGVLLSRASPLAVMEFVIRPAMLRLTVPQQLLASIGGALATYYVSHGPADGPYTATSCLAMGAASLVFAILVDTRARRSWLLERQAAVRGAAAGPGPAASAACHGGKAASALAGR